MRLVMLLYPKLTQLDLTGPFEVFSRSPEIQVHLASKSLLPVTDSHGLSLLPTVTFADCPSADILFVPGGPGQLALMDDRETLGFLRSQAANARYLTSVCTGSLVLAAAGLLTGRRATCHWQSLDQLACFGIEPARQRVVVDGNIITGAGVTSGIDFALVLTRRLFGDERAKSIQLSMEYDPEPPLPGGSRTTSEPAIVERLEVLAAQFTSKRREAAQRAARLLDLDRAGTAGF